MENHNLEVTNSKTQTYLHKLWTLKRLPFPQSFRQNGSVNTDYYFSCVISREYGEQH